MLVIILYLPTILQAAEGCLELWPQFVHHDLEDLNTFLLQSKWAETSQLLGQRCRSEPPSNYRYAHLQNIVSRITCKETDHGISNCSFITHWRIQNNTFYCETGKVTTIGNYIKNSYCNQITGPGHERSEFTSSGMWWYVAGTKWLHLPGFRKNATHKRHNSTSLPHLALFLDPQSWKMKALCLDFLKVLCVCMCVSSNEWKRWQYLAVGWMCIKVSTSEGSVGSD